MAVELHPLHQRRDLTDECIDVINSEWPRSKAMRLHSLEKSCSSLPYSLVMTETKEGKEQVIGYCRLAKVISQPKSVLIETVVIRKDRRGQGMGKKLMELAEIHAKNEGYEAMYLCTYDREKFYERLNYGYCKPVNTLGAQMLENCAVTLETNIPIPFEDKTCGGSCKTSPDPAQNADAVVENNSPEDVSSVQSEIIPSPEIQFDPPPPPPPPPPTSSLCCSGVTNLYWMTKKLTTN